MLDPIQPDEPTKGGAAVANRRRLGRFSIIIDMIRDHPEAVADVLAGTVVIRAEARIDSMTIEYLAWSMEFDPVPEGTMPPWYVAVVTRSRDKLGKPVVRVDWVKQSEPDR